MKQQWAVFIGLSTFVFGIILFCVIFGGYSSLLRSQNRIQASFDLLMTQVRDHAHLNQKVKTHFPGQSASQPAPTQVKQALSAFEKTNHPLPLQQIALLESIIPPLVQELKALAAASPPATLSKDERLMFNNLERRQTEMESQILSRAHRYNKEVDYFNIRSRSFPLKYIARLFKLDQLTYPGLTLAMNPTSSRKG